MFCVGLYFIGSFFWVALGGVLGQTGWSACCVLYCWFFLSFGGVIVGGLLLCSVDGCCFGLVGRFVCVPSRQ